jgi:hypothetical protein
MLWAFALVVACFLVETTVSQLIASTIDDAASRIITDYSPSVIALASARSELHRMQDILSDYVEGGGDHADRERIAASMVDLDRAIEQYLKLPFIPGERELWGRVTADIVESARKRGRRSRRSSGATAPARGCWCGMTCGRRSTARAPTSSATSS